MYLQFHRVDPLFEGGRAGLTLAEYIYQYFQVRIEDLVKTVRLGAAGFRRKEWVAKAGLGKGGWGHTRK